MGKGTSDEHEPIKYISLFSGIEAASVAWEPLGWQPVVFAEFDEFPSAVLKHHYPEVPNVGDVTKHDWTQYKGKCDLVIGGSPCQSFSMAGKRLGLSDPRGNLALHFLRVVSDVQPRWFIFENVGGLLSSDGGRDFETFLTEVAKLGYGFAYRVLDSRFFGVAQKRRRVFVIGHIAGDWRSCAASLFDPESMQRHTQSRKAPRQKSTRVAQSGTGREGEASSSEAEGDSTVVRANDDEQGRRGVTLQTPYNDPSETLVASYATGAGFRGGQERNVIGVAEHDEPVESVGFWTSQSATQRAQPLNKSPCLSATTPTGVAVSNESLDNRPISFWSNESGTQQSSRVDSVGALRTQTTAVALPKDAKAVGMFSNHETTMLDKMPAMGRLPSSLAVEKAAVGFSPWRRGSHAHNIAPTQTAGHENGVAHLKDEEVDFDILPNMEYSVRRLTPIECERLQGFPDDYTKVPYRGKTADKCPKSKRYFVLGNSMTVPVIQWLGEGIDAVDRIGAPPPDLNQPIPAQRTIENGVIIEKPNLDTWFD